MTMLSVPPTIEVNFTAADFVFEAASFANTVESGRSSRPIREATQYEL
jgi:hypothetical protein